MRRHRLGRGHVAAPPKWDATPATEAKEPVRSRLEKGPLAPEDTAFMDLSQTAVHLVGGRRKANSAFQLVEESQKTQLDWNPFAQHQPAQKSTTLGWGRRMSCRTRGPREGGNQANRPPTPEAVAGGQFSDMRRHYGRTCTFKSSRRVRSDVHSENCSWSRCAVPFRLPGMPSNPDHRLPRQMRGRAEKSRATLSHCETAWSVQWDRGNSSELTEAPRPVAGRQAFLLLADSRWSSEDRLIAMFSGPRGVEFSVYALEADAAKRICDCEDLRTILRHWRSE